MTGIEALIRFALYPETFPLPEAFIEPDHKGVAWFPARAR